MKHQSEEVRQIMFDVKHCTPDELHTLYGIELREDGTVFDTTFQTEHKSINEWIDSTSLEDDVGFEKFGTQYGSDDDYY